MKITSISQYMLKYQKAKAKLIEYGVNKEDYPNFPLNSNELSYTTIYIISKYVESIIEGNPDTRGEFSPYLLLASQYFDAASNAKDREIYDTDFLLSGATAYFLSDDFGSAKVLCSRINISNHEETPQGLLLALYRYLLLNRTLPTTEEKSSYGIILNNIKNYFESGVLETASQDVFKNYQKEVYRQDKPIDIYYVDILLAVISESFEKSSWKLLPIYSQQDKSAWIPYFLKPDSIKMLWPSQQLIGEEGILSGNNAIIQLPTGVGKTKSIELIIRSAFISNRARSVIIVAPLRALCNEITNELYQTFESEVVINQFTDVLQEDFSFDILNLFKKHIYVCTPEKISYIMHHQEDILSEIDLFIFDEAHMFDDGKRGATYEFLVSEIQSSMTDKKQIILLSAVLSNADQIKKWIFGDEGIIATSNRIKPTPKSIGFASGSRDIYYYTDNANEYDYFIPKSIETYKLKMFNRERVEKLFPVLSDAKDIAIYYAIKLCHNGGVAIYVNRSDSVNTTMKRILDIVKREYDLSNVTTETDTEEAEKIRNLIVAYYGEEHEFALAASLGVFPHYADLPNGIRIAIEYAIRRNKIRFVVCTTTLAQGVNIPIKYLFLTSFKASRESMQIRNFQNLIGRTARSGMYTEGSIVVTEPRFYDERKDKKHGGIYRWDDCIQMFNPSGAEPCGSSILSLLKNIELDYEYYYEGKVFIQSLIKHYSEDDFYEKIIASISKLFLQKKPDSKQNAIRSTIMLKKNIVESIENHLCFILSKKFENDNRDQVVRTCQNTLAYYLANDEEKDLLLQLFSKIAQKIVSYGDSTKIYNFARTMIGIDLSQKIADWIIEKEILQLYYSEEQLLDMIIQFFFETHSVKISQEEFVVICKAWINGKNFIDIKSYLEIKLSIGIIEDLCSKTISYQLSFFLGNIIDMIYIDSEDENLEDFHLLLNTLQKKIKYGVGSNTAIVFCEEVFNDRYIANKITTMLPGKDLEPKKLISCIKNERDIIYSYLTQFPSYFKVRLDFLLNK